MHRSVVWPEASGPVTAEYLGETTAHETLVSAVDHFWRGSLSVSKDGSGVVRGANFLSPGIKVRFVDFRGHAIEPAEVMLACEESERLHALRRFARLRKGRTAPYRSAPVPRTGKRSGGRYYRRMKTTQEIKAALSLLADDVAVEHRIRARPSRNGRNLVQAWDDVPILRDDRSWKRFRKTQWKERCAVG